MTPKCFDSSWRKFVDDNNLVVGDALIFELLESSSVKVMFKVQFLSCAIPPELQEQINKSRAERQAIIIDDEQDIEWFLIENYLLKIWNIE